MMKKLNTELFSAVLALNRFASSETTFIVAVVVYIAVLAGIGLYYGS